MMKDLKRGIKKTKKLKHKIDKFFDNLAEASVDLMDKSEKGIEILRGIFKRERKNK